MNMKVKEIILFVPILATFTVFYLINNEIEAAFNLKKPITVARTKISNVAGAAKQTYMNKPVTTARTKISNAMDAASIRAIVGTAYGLATKKRCTIEKENGEKVANASTSECTTLCVNKSEKAYQMLSKFYRELETLLKTMYKKKTIGIHFYIKLNPTCRVIGNRSFCQCNDKGKIWTTPDTKEILKQFFQPSSHKVKNLTRSVDYGYYTPVDPKKSEPSFAYKFYKYSFITLLVIIFSPLVAAAAFVAIPVLLIG